jgi:hypothetical protein
MTMFSLFSFAASVPPETGIGVGIGGTGLAGLIFYFYRQERTRSDTLTERVLEVLQGNTVAITRLTDAVAHLEGRLAQ